MATATINKTRASVTGRKMPTFAKNAKVGHADEGLRRKKAPIGEAGRFGVYGGRYVPETLMAALEELEREYAKAQRDKKFRAEFQRLLEEYAGRPTPLFHARRLSKQLGGAKIYLKRE